MSYKYKFTVFTPCYNSENIITRLFDSLLEQTFTDFEWIVIDDCSKDKTREIIETLIPKATFPIKYIKNEVNQMETKNIDIALEYAEGELFTKVSHDDKLLPHALQVYNEAWNRVQKEKIDNVAGVVCNCVFKDGSFEGTKFPKDFWIADDYQMRFEYKIKGEKCSAQRTDILKKYKFSYPEVDKYIPAMNHFLSMNFDYKQVYVNKTARVHIIGEDTHVNLESITKNGGNYPKGFAFYYSNVINKFHSKIWKYDKKAYFLFYINYVRYSRYAGKSYREIIRGAKAHHTLVYPSIILGNINELVKFKKLL
ncbi:MAG: glycosyltransferase family 2 protein [Flavobacteriales bacterium]|nr:glycosyltransferase family 2 protein [Flavobacteriales bacterium]